MFFGKSHKKTCRSHTTDHICFCKIHVQVVPPIRALTGLIKASNLCANVPPTPSKTPLTQGVRVYTMINKNVVSNMGAIKLSLMAFAKRNPTVLFLNDSFSDIHEE